ncbi:GtrA family protein [[Clostridium] colinum]|uniref:GtrA family protein n=1 Tax=[Clostridium] colinum TaxID=36835 RepID=UPI00202482A5|nr:GtrA family protein [[Clostridium] colinum]
MFKSILKKLFTKEILLYLIFGVLTTLVDTVVFYVSNYKLNIHYVLSTCLAWLLAVLFAYITNKLFVFSYKNSQNILKEMFYFFSLRFVSLLLSIVFMVIMVDILNIQELLSKILVNVFVVIANYFFSKIFIFKS